MDAPNRIENGTNKNPWPSILTTASVQPQNNDSIINKTGVSILDRELEKSPSTSTPPSKFAKQEQNPEKKQQLQQLNDILMKHTPQGKPGENPLFMNIDEEMEFYQKKKMLETGFLNEEISKEIPTLELNDKIFSDYESIKTKLEKAFIEAQEQVYKENRNWGQGKSEPFALKSLEIIDQSAFSQTLDENLFPLVGEVGIGSTRGLRYEMEDAYQVTAFEVNDLKVVLWGVFDGHMSPKGTKTEETYATFIAKTLPSYIKKKFETFLIKDTFNNKETELKIFNTLKTSFVEIYRKYKNVQVEGATTAIVVLNIMNKIWTINLGDSRALLIKNGEKILLSRDQKIEDFNGKEKKRKPMIITRCKGTENEHLKICYGSGMVSTPNAVGHPEDSGINPRPKLTQINLDGDDNLLILGCDGFWVASPDQVKIAVKDFQDTALKEKGKEPSCKEIADFLVRKSIATEKNEDNITVLVVKPPRLAD